MNVFFFGEFSKQLFGVYHPPHPRKDRRKGIVLCNPIGQEYIRSHRSFAQLAEKLGDAGFHVLRFDYYGTGDAYGDFQDASPDQWLADISLAVEEIQDYGEIESVALVGLRIGATLAMMAASRINAITDLVLWDPVANGARYLQEINDAHQHWLNDLLPHPPTSVLSEAGGEVLGFPMSKSLIGKIESLRLENISGIHAKRILLLESISAAEFEALNLHISGLKKSVTRKKLENATIWKKGNSLNSVLMPNEALQTIIEWLTH